MAERKKIYDEITELMKGDLFGYGKELAGGDEGFERLLDEGTVAGSDGKRIPGKKGRDDKKRGEMLGKLLEDGEPIYIYKKGEEYPREVRYDPKTGKIEAGKKPLNELRPDELAQKPAKPGILARYFDFLAKFFGGRVDSCRKWDRYEQQQEALKNVKDEKRVNRRRRFDPILNGTEKAGQEHENEKEVGKESGTKELSPKEKEQNALELRLLRNLEKEKQLQEQLRQLREENAQIEKSLAGKGSIQSEKKEPAPLKNTSASPNLKDPAADDAKTAETLQAEETQKSKEQQVKDDRKLAKELQKEENKKYIDEQQQIKSDAELAKSLQEKEEKQQPPQPEVDELLRKLKGGNDGKKLPENVENNLRRLYSDAQKGRQVLTDALNDPKNEKLAGGNTVSNIIAYENIKNRINDLGGDEELLQDLSNKDFVPLWKDATRLSPDVVYASDYPHDKKFFEKNVLSPEGAQKLSRSVDRGINKVIVQQGLNPDGFSENRNIFWGPSNEAEKMAMKEESEEKPAAQEEEIRVGRQPYKKPIVDHGSLQMKKADVPKAEQLGEPELENPVPV